MGRYDVQKKLENNYRCCRWNMTRIKRSNQELQGENQEPDQDARRYLQWNGHRQEKENTNKNSFKEYLTS